MLRTNILFCWALMLTATTSLFAQPVNDACADAIDISSAFEVGPTDTIIVGPYNNTAATPGEIPATSCWFDNADNGSVWFTFTADAGTYDIVTNLACAGINPDDLNPDTQFLLYSGSCGNFTEVACNDDPSANVFTAGLFGIALESGVTYYLAVDGWSNDMGAFFQGEFCIQVNQGAGFSCDDASAGEYVLGAGDSSVCFNDTLNLVMTAPAVIPPLGGGGLNYFHWVVTSEDISGQTMSIYGDTDLFLAQFGQNGSDYNIVYVNNPENGLPAGSYWFTPVIAVNAMDTDGTFGGLDFSEGCFLAGQSAQINLLDMVEQLDVTVDVVPDTDMTMGGATATLTTSGGSGNYTFLWSNGDTTAMVDSLADGNYTVTVSDAGDCIDDVVVNVNVNSEPPNICEGGSAGEYILGSDSSDICFNDTLFLTMTVLDSIPVIAGDGLNFFHWIVTSDDISDTTMSVYADDIYLGQFGQTTGAYDIIYVNNPANGLPTGTYWFTPIVVANAMDTNGTFGGLDFSNGCFLAGQSIEVNLLDSLGQLDVVVDIMPDLDMTMGGAVATANTSGGSGNYSFLWSTGDSTAVVDSLAEGSYTLTVTDESVCVDDVVVTVVVSSNAYPDACADAVQIDTLFGGGMGISLTSTLYDNLSATTDSSDNENGAACFLEPQFNEELFNATVWFTFTGDGLPYNITTTNCNATNYLSLEETQFILYSGDDCGNLTPIGCGYEIPGFSSGEINVETEDGLNYYLLIDGLSTSTGEFCVQVTQMDFISCDDINPGTPELQTSVDVCPNDNISIVLTESAVIPELPGFNVFLYLVTLTDITNSTNLASVDASIVGNAPQQQQGYDFNANASVFDGNTGTFYITPVAIGGAYDGGDNLSDLDLTNGCIQIGTSIPINLLAETVIEGEISSTPANEVNGSNDGTATVNVTVGSGNYTYEWSNGGSTATIEGLSQGDYTVTITDNDSLACAAPLVLTVTVDFVSSTNDPSLNAALQLYPNPAKDQVNLRYDLGTSQDINLSIVNALGQVVLNQKLTNVSAGNLPIDISQLHAGLYQLRITDGKRQAVKTLVIE